MSLPCLANWVHFLKRLKQFQIILIIPIAKFLNLIGFTGHDLSINRTVRKCNWTVYASCLSNWTLHVTARALMDQSHLNKFLIIILLNQKMELELAVAFILKFNHIYYNKYFRGEGPLQHTLKLKIVSQCNIFQPLSCSLLSVPHL